MCVARAAFCTVDGFPKPVWDRVLNQAMESYAMKDVFDMESTVRVEAIENLGEETLKLNCFPSCIVDY